MNQKVLLQVCESLRSTPLRMEQQIVFGLQLIAWTLVSAQGKLPAATNVSAYLEGGSTKAMSGLVDLEYKNDLLGQALAGCQSSINIAGESSVRAALELCRKLYQDGILGSYSPVGVAEMFADWHGSSVGVSDSLVELVVKLAGVELKNDACVAWDDLGQITGMLLPKVSSVFVENKISSPLPALMAIFVGGNLDVRFSDPIQMPSAIEMGELRKFDVAIGIPPIGARVDSSFASKDLFGRFNIPKATWSVLAVQHLLARAKNRVVAVVPSSLLFGAGADRMFREELLRDGKIKAVIALPAGLLSGTNIPVAVLVLSPAERNKYIRFVNASDDYLVNTQSKIRSSIKDVDAIVGLAFGHSVNALFAEGRNEEFAVDVPTENVLLNDAQLQVSRYLISTQQKQIQEKIASYKRVKLGDLVETVRPVATSSVMKDDAIEVHEIAASDLPTYGFINGSSRVVYVDKAILQKAKNPYLQPNDIVMIVKGSVGKVGIVPENLSPEAPGAWVPVQSATVLRLKPGATVDAHALAMILRSPLGQQLLSSITSGAVIPLISLRELLALEIPVPSPEDQIKAVTTLQTEAKLQEQIESLRKQQAVAAEGLWDT